MINIDKTEMGYHEFLSLFFYIIGMKISYYKNDHAKNKIYFENIKYLANKTGFKRFMIQSTDFICEYN